MSRKIVKVVAENWQCWEELELELSPGLNVLVGSSDNGKSSLLRMIQAPLSGRAEIEWITWDKKKLKSQLHFDDGSVVTRERSSRANMVSFQAAGQAEPTTWERIGTSLPREYTQLLGNHEIELTDGEKISPCFSLQADPHFFLSLSDQAKARLVGTISGVDLVDGALSLVSNDMRKSQIRERELREEVDGLEQEHKLASEEVEVLDKKVKLLEQAMEFITSAEKKSSRQVTFEKLRSDFEESKRDVSDARDRLEKTKEATTKLEKMSKALSELPKKLANLSSLRIDLKEVTADATTFADRLNRLDDEKRALVASSDVMVSAAAAAKRVGKLSKLRLEYQQNKDDLYGVGELVETVSGKVVKLVSAQKVLKDIGDLASRLGTLGRKLRDYKDTKYELTDTEEDIRDLEQRLSETKVKISDDNAALTSVNASIERCPTCKRPM